MRQIRCPHCGSKDCKERVVTLEKIADVAVEFGTEAIRSFFSGGGMNYQRVANSVSENAAFNSGLNKNNKKTPYRCRACGYTWESKC